ncbi:hypothetical protein P7K49_023657 [Saguinus oedipus]|uniref:Uncharacterized protein n=1 Tax=Saguinus oedipus TaxID=9490 RepID=A0ABQ9UM97_SAGOE|nr:hypothetical protein P7K49_023657 [Saguinus oedipus]
MGAANFEQFLQERVKVNRKAGKLGWGHGDHRKEQEQDHCDIRGDFFQKRDDQSLFPVSFGPLPLGLGQESKPLPDSPPLVPRPGQAGRTVHIL